MRQYQELLKNILENGTRQANRTGIDTLSVLGRMIRFDLQEGFPLLTTKKVPFLLVAHELLWLISGSTNIKYLVDHNVNIWNDWPLKRYLQEQGLWQNAQPGSVTYKQQMDEFVRLIKTGNTFAKQWGDLGPVYGKQWRCWQGEGGETIDQLANAIRLIQTDPTSRRIIVTAWNPTEIPAMIPSGLPPCHWSFQFSVQNKKLTCLLNMRSVDVFLGLPFNIASYALLTSLVAHITGTTAHELIISMMDTHIYVNHMDQVTEQLTREPLKLPTLWINPQQIEIDGFRIHDIKIIDYNSHPAIKGDIAV